MPQIKCEVSGTIFVRDPPARTLERLRRALSLPHPEFSRALARGIPIGNVPDRWHATTEAPDGLVVPRGAISVLKSILLEDGLVPEFVDRRSIGSPLSVTRIPDSGYRDYQLEGCSELSSHLQGLVVLPCGGGKTTLGVAAIARLLRTTLVVVHTEDLLRQWVSSVNHNAGIRAGTIGGGKVRLGAVTVAIVDSLLSLLSELPRFGECFGLVIVDEAHHAPADKLRRALSQLPAKYRLGLTATPEREDGLGRAVDWLFGERLLERSADELSARGLLVRPEVVAVRTEFEFDADKFLEKKRQNEMNKKLVKDDNRNQIICKIVLNEVSKKQSVLVLTSRKDHVAELSRLLSCPSVTGDTPTAERERLVNSFREEEIPVMIATQLFDEGVDLPGLSRIVLAMPERARGKTTQRVGRLMRPKSGKLPKLYDVVDARVPTLESRWRARRTTYRKMGLAVREQS